MEFKVIELTSTTTGVKYWWVSKWQYGTNFDHKPTKEEMEEWYNKIVL